MDRQAMMDIGSALLEPVHDRLFVPSYKMKQQYNGRANKTFHRTAIPLRSSPASELCC